MGRSSRFYNVEPPATSGGTRTFAEWARDQEIVLQACGAQQGQSDIRIPKLST